MKYLRKALVIVLVAVFLAATAIGMSVIFAVRNINVFTIEYDCGKGTSAEFSDAVEKVKAELASLRGRIVSGISENDIKETVNSEGYTEFVSCKIVMPCTINVIVRERVEVYAAPAENGGYLMLDETLSPVAERAFNSNNLDGSPNVLLENIPAENYGIVAELTALMREKFASVRAFAESVSVEKAGLEGLGDSLCIKLRCGLTMEIRDYTDSAAEKAEALFSTFENMADHLKLGGTMYCLASEDGAMRVVLPDGSYI